MDQVLSLVGRFYDAALDPDLWIDVMHQVDVFLECAQSFVVFEDTTDPSAGVVYGSVRDPSWVQRYFDSYMLINPTRLAMAWRLKAGDTIITTDFMTPAEYSATRFSRELLTEQRIADIAVSILEQTATRFTVLSVHRSFEQGFADEALRRKLQLIMPHVQRAVKIARLFEHHKMVASTFADTLDRLTSAVFLLTRSGGVLHANAQGAALLAEADVARAIHGNLVLADKAAGAALALALGRAANGDTAADATGHSIAVTTRSERKFVVTVMPLAGRRRACGSPSDAVAAVCIKEAEFAVPSSAETLASLHSLTRRETAILVASVEQGGVADVAAVMGIGEATVRSHLKAIFRKTGAARQADLTKLLAGVASPFGAAQPATRSCRTQGRHSS